MVNFECELNFKHTLKSTNTDIPAIQPVVILLQEDNSEHMDSQ